MSEEYSRYNVQGLEEAELESGASEPILKNLLGLKSQAALDEAEEDALKEVQNRIVDSYENIHLFTVADLCNIHALWLGKIYAWAGSYRQVNLSKDGFPFAAAAQIPNLMVRYEKDFLSRFTPCVFKDIDKVAEAIAITHAELILIHPFREGNGRLARLLANLMALQAQLPALDFEVLTLDNRQPYILAIQQSLDLNYQPLQMLFAKVIEQSLNRYHV